MSSEQSWESWAILDLMGHLKLAGKLTEQTIAGSAFLRIDVPGDEEHEPLTQFYSAASVYSISPCSEELARAMARTCRPEPIRSWQLPAEFQRRAIAPPDDGWDDDDPVSDEEGEL